MARGRSAVALETVIEGFEELPKAVGRLFNGASVGELVVHVGENGANGCRTVPGP